MIIGPRGEVWSTLGPYIYLAKPDISPPPPPPEPYICRTDKGRQQSIPYFKKCFLPFRVPYKMPQKCSTRIIQFYCFPQIKI